MVVATTLDISCVTFSSVVYASSTVAPTSMDASLAWDAYVATIVAMWLLCCSAFVSACRAVFIATSFDAYAFLAAFLAFFFKIIWSSSFAADSVTAIVTPYATLVRTE